MTEIIAGKRQSGRSTALIKKSAETGIYILVANRKRAEHLALLARDLGYDIPFPVTLQDYLRCRFTGSCMRRDGIFIDDVDDVVKELFDPIEIKAVTFLYDAESRAEVDNLEYTLAGVMHSVDKWLDGDEFEQDEVNRAITMREKTLRIIETIKAETVREIFAEIESCLDYIEEQLDDIPDSFTCVKEDIATLKKKYTEVAK